MDWGSLKPIQALAAKVFYEKRRLLLMLPRQEGKTELGVRLIHSLISDPNTHQALFLAKSHEAAKKATREKFRRLFSPQQFNVTTKMVTNKANEDAVCFIDSVDKEPDRIRGGTYQLIVWTEIAFSEFENEVTLFDVVQKILMPTQRKTRGFFFGESTPNGQNDWSTLWNNAPDYGMHTLRVGLSDLVRMGLIKEKEYNEIQSTTHPTVFRQEYECEFVSFAGRIYDELTEGHIKTFDTPPHLTMVACAIDWGFVDATCLLAAFKMGGKIYVFDEIYVKKTLIEEFAAEFKQRMTMWDALSMSCVADHDPARIEELHRRGIPCGNAAKANVLGNRIQIKELLWKNEIVIHPRCKHLIMDLKSMEWDSKTKREDANYSKCTWGHYDAEAALRYLIRELSEISSVENEIKLTTGGRDANNPWGIEA